MRLDSLAKKLRERGLNAEYNTEWPHPEVLVHISDDINLEIVRWNGILVIQKNGSAAEPDWFRSFIWNNEDVVQSGARYSARPK